MEFPPWTNAIGHAGEVRVRSLAASGRAPLLYAGALLAALGCATAGTGWVRTELFLGRGLPDGGTLSEAQVEAFLAREAGSRLGGWTLVEARGYWTSPDGGAVNEPTSVLVVLHPPGQDDQTIEEIRRTYAREHGQQSVLRVDTPAGARF